MSKQNFVIALFLTCLFGWWFLRPADLHSADLGRHIMNGQIILTQPSEAYKVLHTNYYSYTAPNAPFVNHHWLSGVIFYLIYNYSGFTGLEILSIVVNTLAFVLYFRIGIKRGGFFAASLVAAALIPLVAERTEIRPEMFTYLLSGAFLTILLGVTERALKPKYLLLLPPLMLLWINLHIYFFLGFVFIALYWVTAVIKKNTLARPLFLTGAGCVLGALCNPSCIYGLFYPFFIFKNYAIKTFENQSVFGLTALGKTHPNFLLLELGTALLLVAYTALLLRKPKTIRLPEILLSFLTATWAFGAIRNLSVFGFVALATIPAALSDAFPDLFPKTNNSLFRRVLGVAMFVILSSTISISRIEYQAQNTHFGLVPHTTDPADFINKNNISGPMFNDFDVGSYAEFYFYPRIKPFIDNRPEAFPGSFITDTYLPLQLRDTVWQQALQKYNFNVILYHFDIKENVTNKFLIARLHDPEWAPVFADDLAIIFLRRTPQNQPLITAHEIPLSTFKF